MAPSLVKVAVFSFSLFGSISSALHNVDSPIQKRANLLIATNTLPGKWVSQGCYQDNVNGARTFGEAGYTDAVAMTEESCVKYCDTQGYIFAGIEYSQECYCGTRATANVTAPITDCQMACTGNTTEACGGPNRLNVFWSGKTPPPAPVTNPGPPGWLLLGCYTEGNGGRLLTTGMGVNGGATKMSVAACTFACNNANFIYAGVEYADECYCGNTLSNGGTITTGFGDCNMVCAGNSSEFCGAGNRLDLYGLSGSVAPVAVVSSTTSTKSSTSVGISTSTTTSPTAAATQTGPIHVPSVAGYNWIGCYTEATNGRALNQKTTIDYAGMTIEKCEALCSAPVAYTYFGVEYGGECYCGNAFQAGSVLAATTDCSFLCPGSSLEYCGAGNRLDAYQVGGAGPASVSSGTASTTSTSSTALATQTGPIHVPSVAGYSWIGCYTEATNGRALNQKTTIDYVGMTIEKCEALCSAPVAYTYFGVEYGGECYCGNAFQAGSVVAATTDCSFLCPGSSLEYCGAGNRLDAYKVGAAGPSSQSSGTATGSTTATTSTGGTKTSTSSTALATQTGPIHVPSVGGYTWIGCYTEATGQRALNQKTTIDYVGMTIEKCEALCSSPVAYTYFGVEYGGECYCGNAFQAGSVVAATTDCSMLCPGSSLEYCGAGNRLDAYQVGANGPSSVSKSTGTASTTNTASVSTTSNPTTATGLPAGWKYASCFSEGTTGRALNFEQPDNQQLTVESCVNTCVGLGYSVAGIEFGVQCFCDNFIQNGAVAAPETDCSFACPGNAAEKCGAGDRLNVYYTGTLTVYAPPAAQTSGIPGSWTYSGCWSDNVNQVRALTWQIILTNNNSATNCLGLCAEFGYMAGGMEYGDECYCGDDSFLLSTGSTQYPDSQCNTVCSGNPNYVCGQGNRLSYYKWTGTPLYQWATPQGNAAGQYQFLVPGVVVPLQTSLAINGKVTFLEKGGTGAPNTTGAYELDLTLVNNFAAAWRTMHVKTDIFCSGGLTLPDIAGRQITIGGWSGESTYGVRLYWPDGSAGVPGQHDWQENVNEVTLQTGRWYPSSLVLSNGSILVMGGEVGSNAAANPTLEILPKPAGGYLKYLDWLQRTDPNNLYPFLFILPNGQIFVGYYNEARILDPVTFDTIVQLPNIPGSVADFLSGRTYPLEGTGVLLPQSAANNWAVTVLICGGSSIGNAMALDNCVSINPLDANPVWVIERMPSQRVMTCMVALPDGTYLINNGAHHGVAGFGLANSPNLNAVLYDPTKPIGSRMSILANTIVARLYHSESILLQDGSVLVSGSDPEDGVNPEEYRVEKFFPPYLLAGNTPPSFHITERDWVHGQTYQITNVNLPQGGPIRISLLGAVSSTHGNSFGMKTLFPTFNCAGNTCTITAPPNNFVAPPGWFQLFILDGPTPSFSAFIRIGGDPASLGNWPAGLSDFITPGLGTF